MNAWPVRVGIISAWIILSSVSAAHAADSRIADAMKNRNTAAVRTLLDEHADVNTPQADGATALHWAVHWDDLDSMDLLIRSGAHVNAADDDGATPLYLACLNRSPSAVDKLLNAGANANAALISGETALMTCARTGDAASIRLLLKHGADVNAAERLHNQTALMWAAAENHPGAVQALLEGSANVHARSRIYTQTVSSTLATNRADLAFTVRRGGSTPLLFAARAGGIESAKLLIAAKADVNDTLPDGMSALVEAAYSGRGEFGKFLLSAGADPNSAGSGIAALHAAVLKSESDLVKALLAHGADPNVRIAKGTPLRRSSTDFNLPPAWVGATPYLLAAKFLEVEIMGTLLDGGADPKLPTKDGTTPLMAAAGVGARVNQNRRGRTTIDGGIPEDENLVLRAVQAALTNCDVNAVNADGDTALHGAAPMGYDRVVELLAAHGANLEVRNKKGETPLALASVQSNNDGFQPRVSRPSTAALLRKLGATK